MTGEIINGLIVIDVIFGLIAVGDNNFQTVNLFYSRDAMQYDNCPEYLTGFTFVK